MKKYMIICCLLGTIFMSCDEGKSIQEDSPNLVFKIKFDSTQQRLDAIGQLASIGVGNAAQHPDFNGISLHNIELVPNATTVPKTGETVYVGVETSAGSSNAINFNEAVIKADGETFFSIPLSQVQAGTYEYIRTSVSYQNFDIAYNIINIPVVGNLNNQKGSLASFVGFNNYITTMQVADMTHTVNADKLQGYWAFETKLSSPYDSYNQVYAGEATVTTVVNPLSSSAPTPPGSCLVTGTFDGNSLVITGNETADIVVELSYCTNNSFEWQDNNANGEWDIDASANSVEAVVDMGLRGLTATVK